MGGRRGILASWTVLAVLVPALCATTACKKDLPDWYTSDAGDEGADPDGSSTVDDGSKDPGPRDDGGPGDEAPDPLGGDVLPDPLSDVPVEIPLSVKFATPTDQAVLSGAVDIEVAVEFTAGAAWDLSVVFVDGMPTPLAKSGSGSASVAFPVDTRTVVDGPWKLRATVRDAKGKEASAEISVTVDNTPPEVLLQVRVEGDGGVVTGRIELGLRAKDLQSGIASARLSADGVEQKAWGAELADVTFVLDAKDWAYGPHTIVLDATDRAGNPAQDSRQVRMVPPPTVAGFAERTNLWTDAVTGGVGIRLGPASDGAWGVLLAGTRNVHLVERILPTLGLLTIRKDIACTGFQVADIDQDGRDDAVGWCREARVFLVLLQRPGDDGHSAFEEVQVPGPMAGENPIAVRDFALGDISQDGLPDIVAVVDDAQQPVVLYRSSPLAGSAAFRDPERYAGGFAPTLVAVGDLADNGRNAIVIATDVVPTVTVFPVTAAGIVLHGENTFVGDLDDAGNPYPVDFRDLLPILHRPGTGATGPHRLFLTSKEAGSVAPYLRSLSAVPARQSFTLSRIFDSAAGQGPARIAAGDVDGDGVVDAAMLDTGSRILQVWRFTATGEPGADAAACDGPPDSFAVGNAVDVTMADLGGDGRMEVVLVYPDRVVAAAWGPGQVPQAAGGGASCAWLDLPDAAPIPGSLAVALPVSCPPGPSAVGRLLPIRPAPARRGLDLMTFPPKGPSLIFPIDLEWGVPGRQATGSPCEATHPAAVTRVVAGDITPDLPADQPLDDLLSMNEVCDKNEHKTVTFGVDYNESYLGFGGAPVTQGVGHTWMCRPALAALGQFDTGWGVADKAAEIAVLTTDEFPGLSLYAPITASSQAALFTMSLSKTRLPVKKILAASIRRSLAEATSGGPFETDLLVLNGGTKDFTIFVNQGNWTLSAEGASKNFSVGRPPVDLAVGYLDVPVDGTATAEETARHLPDVVVLSTQGLHVSFSLDNVAEVAADSKALEFLPPWYVEYPKLPYSTPGLHRVALSDVNRDGYLDILVLDRNRSELAVYLNLSDRTFSLVGRYAVGTDPIDLLPGDLDGDGTTDMTTVDSVGRTFTFARTLPAPIIH